MFLQLFGSLGGEQGLSYCEKHILPWALKGVLLGGVSGTCGFQGACKWVRVIRICKL